MSVVTSARCSAASLMAATQTPLALTQSRCGQQFAQRQNSGQRRADVVREGGEHGFDPGLVWRSGFGGRLCLPLCPPLGLRSRLGRGLGCGLHVAAQGAILAAHPLRFLFDPASAICSLPGRTMPRSVPAPGQSNVRHVATTRRIGARQVDPDHAPDVGLRRPAGAQFAQPGRRVDLDSLRPCTSRISR